VPDPRSSYAISKLAGWEHAKLYARLHGFSVLALRPTLIYGPGQGHNLISALADSAKRRVPEVRLAGGSQTRAPLFIDDAIEAFVRAAELGAELSGHVINLGGPTEHAVSEIASLTLSVLGSSAQVQVDTARATETSRSYCDNLGAKRLLDWEPQTGLLAGLEKTLRASSGG
jgi:UDP-glucose 4-epimerase